jgi:hypothetical protein
MNCETVRAAVIDALADTIDDETGAALDAHIAQCEACSTEAAAIRALWTDLGRLDAPALTADAVARMRTALVVGSGPRTATRDAPGSGDVARNDRSPGGNSRRTLLAASIALLMGLAGGWTARSLTGISGDDSSPATAAAPQDGLEPDLILLRGPPAPPPGSPPQDEAAVAAAVARYTAWADTLRAQGRLVSAEKLEDGTGRWLGEFPPEGPPGSDIGGFFLIRARSWAEAEAIAATGPHIGYGGTIELRAIENTGG